MSKEKLIQLKKYLSYVSIIFVVITLIHLIYSYLYHDASIVPIKGWNISEWIIWEYPSLNPLTGEWWNNHYIMNLLYRSILNYDLKTGEIDDDLASCDTSNLLRIECYIENGVKWSDGTDITADDIVATYQLLQNSNINTVMSSLLANTEIIQNDASIVFINPTKDINFLNIFFQPILPENILQNLSETELVGRFQANTTLYSWKFQLSSVHIDTSLWVTKFFLQKNPHYNAGDIFIDQLIIKLFPTLQELLKNKESVQIINDPNNLIGESISRLEAHPYTLNQYVWVFLNKETISDANMRSFLLNNINRENLISILWTSSFTPVINPYLNEINIDSQADNKNIASIIARLWYKRKSEIFTDFIKDEKIRLNYSAEANIDTRATEVITQEASTGATNKSYSLWDFQEASKTIFEPSYVEKYNYITNTDIVLRWNAPQNVQAVYINDYKLQKFNPWDSIFNYRVSAFIQQWINNYDIYFEIDGEKQLQEQLTFIYHPQKQSLDTLLNDFVIELWKQQEEKQAQTAAEIIQNDTVETDPVQTNEFTPDPQKLAEIEALDDENFYNEQAEVFAYTLYYTDSSLYLEQSAQYIKTSLEEKWIRINIEAIGLNELPQLLKQKDSYDMILAGIHTGYFDFNIFPYFHSSQANIGYNFSGLKKLSVDILLEELKSSVLDSKKREELTTKVLDYLKEEQILKTLYTPVGVNLVDKNINNYKPLTHMPTPWVRIHAISQIYVNEKKIIDFNEKNIIGFIHYLIDIL